MKAITVEPGKPGTARLEEVPEPDPREGSVLVVGIEPEYAMTVDASLGVLGVLLAPIAFPATRGCTHGHS